MAEAGVETASSSARFFCHKCNVEITPRLPDYVCPRCDSGFIEELEGGGGGESDSDTSSDMELESYDMMWDVLAPDAASGGGGGSTNAGSSSGPRRSQRLRHSLNPRHGRRRVSGGDRQSTLAPLLHDLIMQMTSGVIEASVGGADLAGLPVGFDLPGFPVQLVASNLAGNPGDYAWGRGGLDAIITQLMNQLDGTGPPPMPKDKIKQIPTTTIKQEQTGFCCCFAVELCINDQITLRSFCNKTLSSSDVIFRLILHGTCPVCRKSLLNPEEGGGASGGTASATAAGGSSSSNSSNGSSAGARIHFGHSGVSSVSHSGSSSSTSSSSSETPRAGSSGGSQPANTMFEDELD
ncbi:unnamed protein product, partial [Meganyctiphanes norvegica]